MKKLLFVLGFVLIAILSQAQVGIFTPPPKPHAFGNRYGATTTAVIQNNIHVLSTVSANVSNGSAFGAGFGIAMFHDKYVDSTASWNTQYSIGLIGILGTTGTKLTGTGGIMLGLPGTNGIVGVGGGYDFTQGQFVFLTGIQYKFY